MSTYKIKKVALIAHNLRIGGGLAIAHNLITALMEVAPEIEFLIICPDLCGYESLPLSARSRLWIYRGGHGICRRVLFEQFQLGKVVRRFRPDVIFGAGNVGIKRGDCPQSLLIHSPHLLFDANRWGSIPFKEQMRIKWLKKQVSDVLPCTEQIWVQMPLIKEYFIQKYSYPAQKIHILKFPVPAELQGIAKSPMPPVRCDNPDVFLVLMLSRYLPYRNPEIALRLCEKYGDIFRAKKIKFITNVITELCPKSRKFVEDVAAAGLCDLIINIGYRPRSEVISYYQYCDVLWLHTKMETLCFPFIEAMTLGLPILAPDYDFIRYVCGEAAVYYPPEDLDRLRDSLLALLEKPELRNSLRLQGKRELQNSSKYSNDWRQTAEDLLVGLSVLIH